MTHVIYEVFMNFTDLRILKTQERLQNALLKLLETRELKAVTVKEICDMAGISRNAFYQHYSYKEDLYDQMAAQATERIRNALVPVISDESMLRRETVFLYAKNIIKGISEVREIICVMAKSDDGKLMRQLTDLIAAQILSNAYSFYEAEESEELRLYYEFTSAGMAAFILSWIKTPGLSDDKAASLLADILLNSPCARPPMLVRTEKKTD